MIPQSWIQFSLKMYKIADQILQFIESGIECKRKKLNRGEDPKRLIQVRCTITITLLVIVMMTLNLILRKCTTGYKLNKSQENINHLMYMDSIKVFVKNEKELETLIQIVRIYSKYIGIEFGIEKCATLVIKSGKRHMTEGAELLNQVIIKRLGEKESYKYLGILEVDTIKQQEMKEKL